MNIIRQSRRQINRFKFLSYDEEAELACKEIADIDELLETHFTEDNEMVSGINGMEISNNCNTSTVKRPVSRSSSPVTRSKNAKLETMISA